MKTIMGVIIAFLLVAAPTPRTSAQTASKNAWVSLFLEQNRVCNVHARNSSNNYWPAVILNWTVEGMW